MSTHLFNCNVRVVPVSRVFFETFVVSIAVDAAIGMLAKWYEMIAVTCHGRRASKRGFENSSG